MSWRLARSLVVLRSEINERWPNRDKKSDGTIGDVRHQNEGSASDHNPWIKDSKGVGVVRAFDIDSGPGIDINWVAEHIRALGKAGDARLQNNGYVIWNRKIASANHNNWAWRTYTGSDPHTSHVHVSVSRSAAGYDSLRSWGIDPDDPDPTKPKPKPVYTGWKPGSRTIRKGNTSGDVLYLNHRFFGLVKNDVFGTRLETAVKKFQRRNHLTPDGVVGPLTWKKLGVKYTGKK